MLHEATVHYVRCDGRDCQAGGRGGPKETLRFSEPGQAHAHANKLGWLRIDDWHFCPKCQLTGAYWSTCGHCNRVVHAPEVVDGACQLCRGSAVEPNYVTIRQTAGGAA